jgi:hypothetical protein
MDTQVTKKLNGLDLTQMMETIGAIKDDSREVPFEFTNGEPPVLLGGNEGANPVEFLLHALDEGIFPG